MTSRNLWFTICGVLFHLGAHSLQAQGTAAPLSLQGLHQTVPNDVRGRGMGGATIASGNSANAIFSNPAALTRLTMGDVRIAGIGISSTQRQLQEWVPNRLYAGLSILMEDKWAGIKEPLVFNPADSTYNPPTSPFERLQKPFDAIGPNWSRASERALPLSVAAALPVEMFDLSFVVGLGGAQAIDLDHYFQNNNVLDPLLGSYRPEPMPVVKTGDTLRVRWYQHTRKREGAIYNIAPAIAMKYGNLSVGVSGTFLYGTSDDWERRWDRGLLSFIYNAFKIDSLHYAETRSGSSTYDGMSGTLGLLWTEERYSLGVTVAMPMTITRSYDRTLTIDTALSSNSWSESGEEKLKMPLRYAVGLVLTPTERWMLSFDYGMTGYAESEQVGSDGTVASSWVGANSLKIGAEYLAASWLALRSGYRQEVQPFAVAGSAIINEPVMSSVLSFGLGTMIGDCSIDIAYEYYALDYQDLWQSNINSNLTVEHRMMLGIGYRF